MILKGHYVNFAAPKIFEKVLKQNSSKQREGIIMAKTKSPTKEPKPKPTAKANQQNLQGLSAQLQKQFGFKGFKGPQEEIIQSLLNGNDTFVIMPTGGGKSLCYQLPAIISNGVAIVVSPLIA